MQTSMRSISDVKRGERIKANPLFAAVWSAECRLQVVPEVPVLFAVDHFCLILILMAVCCALSSSINTSAAICYLYCSREEDC